VGPGPVWTGAENITPTGFRSPDLQTIVSGRNVPPEWLFSLSGVCALTYKQGRVTSRHCEF